MGITPCRFCLPLSSQPTLSFLYWNIIGAHVAALHETLRVELPMLITMGTEPLIARGIPPFVFEPYLNAVASISPELFVKFVVKLPGPLRRVKKALIASRPEKNSSRLRHCESLA